MNKISKFGPHNHGVGVCPKDCPVMVCLGMTVAELVALDTPQARYELGVRRSW